MSDVITAIAMLCLWAVALILILTILGGNGGFDDEDEQDAMGAADGAQNKGQS